MTGAGGRPWLLSLGIHALAVGVILTLLSLPKPPRPALIMHFLPSPGNLSGAPLATGRGPAVAAPGSPPPRPQEPSAPAWQPTAAAPGTEASSIPAEASLNDLLPPQEPSRPSSPSSPAGGWSSPGGEGYAPPPLPPPDLVPPQGARWNLTLFIPAGGGFVSRVDGLTSGHTDLDRWLEAYLRTVAFPSGLDGQPYQVHWNLRLDTGRPQ